MARVLRIDPTCWDAAHAIAPLEDVITPNTSGPSSRTPVGEVGEFALIDAVVARLAAHGAPEVAVGPGDDAAVVALGGDHVVVTTDALVDGVHFRRTWSSGEDVGVRAAAANLADVLAMGADPRGLVVALGVPADLPLGWVLGLADGLGAEAARLGAGVVGGDVVRSPVVTLAVTALGVPGDRGPILRSTARPGDAVVLAGRVGWAAAGLAVLSRGFTSPRVLAQAHRRPEVPYEQAVAIRPLATALCDVSDGLVADAGHLARASGVVVSLRTEALDVGQPLRDVAAAYGSDPLDWVLGGGDDHAFLATVPAAAVPQLPTGWTVIGEVLEPGEGPGVLVDGVEYGGPAGHDHFGAGG